MENVCTQDIILGISYNDDKCILEPNLLQSERWKICYKNDGK